MLLYDGISESAIARQKVARDLKKAFLKDSGDSGKRRFGDYVAEHLGLIGLKHARVVDSVTEQLGMARSTINNYASDFRCGRWFAKTVRVNHKDDKPCMKVALAYCGVARIRASHIRLWVEEGELPAGHDDDPKYCVPLDSDKLCERLERDES